MEQSASSKDELNTLKLEVKHCAEQIKKLRGEVNELKKESFTALVEKLRGEVNELKKEVEATCKEVDSTRDMIYKVAELLTSIN